MHAGRQTDCSGRSGFYQVLKSTENLQRQAPQLSDMDRFFQSYCTLPTPQVPQAPQQMVFLGDQGHDESEYMEALVQASAFDPYNQQSATYRRHVPESSSPYHMWETNQRSSNAGMHKNME
ncbi:hypothetical protein FRC14_006803 [Serendipita sp. 396]|nr:hypothetical protein FRC14_006803 [Serendipita sp. 396]